MTCSADDPIITVEFTWLPDGLLELPPSRPDEGLAGLWWNALTLPAWTMRYTNAPPSSYVPGNVLLAYTPDSSSLTMVVAALGVDTATLETQKALLEAALSRFTYVVTIKVDDEPVDAWRAQPTIPQWGTMTPQRSGLFVAEAALLIPVNPVEAPA